MAISRIMRIPTDLRILKNLPRLYLHDDTQSANNRIWDFAVSGLTLVGRTVNDADSATASWVTVTRSGNTISSVTWGAAQLFPDGTEALPSIANDGDTDTGIRWSADNTLDLVTAGADRWRVTSAGHYIATDDNTYDIGASGATRPRALYLAGNATVGGLTANNLTYAGTGGLLTSLGSATNGQLPIGSTGAAPVLAALTGTANRVTVTNGAGTITLSGPQDLATTSAVTFGALTANGAVNLGRSESGQNDITTMRGFQLGIGTKDVTFQHGVSGGGVWTQTFPGRWEFRVGATDLIGISGAGLYIGGSGLDFGTGMTAGFLMKNGTGPSTSPVDAFQIWSADFAAGDARLYLRTETGNNLILGNGRVETNTGNLTLVGDGIVPGLAALATTATTGFIHLPMCAGTPTGTATTATGMAPLVYDSTNNRFWIYNGAAGTWRAVAVA